MNNEVLDARQEGWQAFLDEQLRGELIQNPHRKYSEPWNAWIRGYAAARFGYESEQLNGSENPAPASG